MAGILLSVAGYFTFSFQDAVVKWLVVDHPVPTKTNVLGVKGCGEAGCAGSLPSVMNAIVHALSEFGIRHFDMPATPYRVWRAIQDARAAHAA